MRDKLLPRRWVDGKAIQRLACSNACRCPVVQWTARLTTYQIRTVASCLRKTKCLEDEKPRREGRHEDSWYLKSTACFPRAITRNSHWGEDLTSQPRVLETTTRAHIYTRSWIYLTTASVAAWQDIAAYHGCLPLETAAYRRSAVSWEVVESILV
jgi:hypothetical protein